VDSSGCSDSQKDTDGDGIADDLDNCPNSPEGGYVDEEGCAVVCNTTYNPTTANIGNQIWTSSNVDITTYCDGTIIPQITLEYNTITGDLSKEWSELTTGAWIYARDCDCGASYTFSTEEEESFGKLYNWYAIAGIHDNDESTPNKQFAPVGWRVPTAADFDTLFMNNTGPALRDSGSIEAGNGKWFESSNYAPGTNESGFSAIPAGFLHGGSGTSPWGNMGFYAYFWTSSVGYVNQLEAISWAVITASDDRNNEEENIETHNKFVLFTPADNNRKNLGMSVRFVKDLE